MAVAGCGGGNGDTATVAAPADAPVDRTNRWAFVGPARDGLGAAQLAAAIAPRANPKT